MKQGFLGKPNCAANIMLTRAAKKKPKPKPDSPPPAALPPSPYNFEIPLAIQKIAAEHSPYQEPTKKKRDANLGQRSKDFQVKVTVVDEPELPAVNQLHYVQATSIANMEHPPGFGPISRPLSKLQSTALGTDFQSGNCAPTWSSLFKNKPRNAGRLEWNFGGCNRLLLSAFIK